MTDGPVGDGAGDPGRAGDPAGDPADGARPTRRAFLSLGSNLGDRRRLLVEAIGSLGPSVVAVSSVYETEPVGGPDQGRFLNVVVELATALPPRDLLAVCHRLESAAGRVRTERWGPRTLDVDIVWIDGVTVDEPDLQVPHPRMWDRRFVLAPLAELAPELVPEGALRDATGTVDVVEPLPGWPGPT
ncbi:MAG: 2-amino-4-hydroxy-6-hydroxymethyldihydropteridine diphosphokinase [Acidimicrobiales bacterium]|nr:2-amino-4-hydroxy-6-hydroxymethyldihydropteridine diphosphokinase [Acidimicrobiales bacterium]HMS88074.1 2-amino-4-hydroxy-6-hydroxymethyldihydropteridine diphosphokinase [Acidimicrobiales bacterium]